MSWAACDCGGFILVWILEDQRPDWGKTDCRLVSTCSTHAKLTKFTGREMRGHMRTRLSVSTVYPLHYATYGGEKRQWGPKVNFDCGSVRRLWWCLFSSNESGLTDKLFVRRLCQSETCITLITLFSADTEFIGCCTTESPWCSTA